MSTKNHTLSRPGHTSDTLVFGTDKVTSYGPRAEPYNDGIVVRVKSAEDAEFWSVYEWRTSPRALDGGRWEWLADCDTEDTARALADVIARVAQQPAGVDEAPDPSLLRFYGVSDYPSLVAAMEEHVLKLIDTHKRNVKPWEDTFPPTLLPKWVREQGVVPTEEGLALAQKWEDEAAESWGEDDAHRAKQECCDELRDLLTAARAALTQEGRND